MRNEIQRPLCRRPYCSRAAYQVSFSFHLTFPYSATLPKATYYTQLRQYRLQAANALTTLLSSDTSIHLHWLDNYARFMARQSISIAKELFLKMYWTAHGVKIWPSSSISFSYIYKNSLSVPAMPSLAYILADDTFDVLFRSLSSRDIPGPA